jgi:hypothetical protein
LEEIAAGIELPSDILEVVVGVVDAFEEFATGTPRLLSIGQDDADHDRHQFEALVGLTPGTLLPVECGLIEGSLDRSDREEPADSADLLELILEGGTACMPIVPQLADIIHGMRIHARRVVADWNAAGIPTRLIDVRLAPYDHWRGRTEPTLRVLIENLNGSLTVEPLEISLETSDDIEKEMGAWREMVATGYASRISMAASGATGTIDQLAINAIAHFGDVEHAMHRLASEDSFRLPDGTVIFAMNGHVHAGNDDPDDHVEWAGRHISVRSTYLPAEQLVHAIGRPLSELLELNFLSDDIVVVKASCLLTDGQPVLTIEVDMPRQLFCSASGRIWDDVEDGLARRPVEQPTGGTVIPFRVR